MKRKYKMSPEQAKKYQPGGIYYNPEAERETIRAKTMQWYCEHCGQPAYYDGRCGDGPILMCGECPRKSSPVQLTKAEAKALQEKHKRNE